MYPSDMIERPIILGAGYSMRSREHKPELLWTEWTVRLGRWTNDKSLDIRLYPPRGLGHMFRHELSVSEYNRNGRLLRTESYELAIKPRDDMRDSVEDKINRVYAGNFFKRLLLIGRGRG